MLKIGFWPRKSARRAYFELEGVEQGWNTTWASGQTMLGLFSKQKRLKNWLFDSKRGKKEAKVGLLATFWPTFGHIWGILGLANGPNWSP